MDGVDAHRFPGVLLVQRRRCPLANTVWAPPQSKAGPTTEVHQPFLSQQIRLPTLNCPGHLGEAPRLQRALTSLS